MSVLHGHHTRALPGTGSLMFVQYDPACWGGTFCWTLSRRSASSALYAATQRAAGGGSRTGTPGDAAERALRAHVSTSAAAADAPNAADCQRAGEPHAARSPGVRRPAPRLGPFGLAVAVHSRGPGLARLAPDTSTSTQRAPGLWGEGAGAGWAAPRSIQVRRPATLAASFRCTSRLAHQRATRPSLPGGARPAGPGRLLILPSPPWGPCRTGS